VQFYVLVPLLTLLFTIRSRKLRRSSIAILILAALSGQALFMHHTPRASLSILAYVQFFLVGFLLADVFLASWGEVPRRNLAWDFVALAGWPLLFVILHSPVLAHWRCCLSRSFRQSLLFESLDHRHRRDVLLHLPPSL
jgi:peptidoglycan/LPS O-acetylase OafA/YrhL